MSPFIKNEELNQTLIEHTREGELYEKLDNQKVRCYACGHRCLIHEGRPGVCRVRLNEGGALRVPYGYVAGLQCDPIEKKPFYHAMPGSEALSFGMLGCDLHCSYCQNWITSQALRDAQATGSFRTISAEQLVELAIRYGASTVTSTYNEPLITAEWAVEVFRLARQAGLRTSFVSNGNGTPQVLHYLKPWTDFYKVDLKSFQDKNYRKLGGTLDAVLNTIRALKTMGYWLEVVTLVVPEMNDSDEELRDMAQFLVSVHPEIPWHVTAFHEDYRMEGVGHTSAQRLQRAAEIGKEEGLQYVYIGNLPGVAPEWENTHCHACGELLIERYGFRVLENRIADGACPRCQTQIPGVWQN